MKYILGVDGGNTKTDYYLFDVSGKFIDMYRGSTCSHEALPTSFEGTYQVLKSVFDCFLKKHNIQTSDIESAVFGLAGDDIPYQHKKLEEVIGRFNFKKFLVANDSVLGIKAGTTNGYGVCSINGTGTSASGIDINNRVLQVGGIGEITGDEAGGRYISRKVVRACFDEVMRFGEKTSLTKITLDLLNNPSYEYLMENIVEIYLKRKVDYNILTVACFEEACKNDSVAIKILTDMADNLARSAGGVVDRLELGLHPEVVLAGSVYVKGSCPILIDEFTKRINKYTKKQCDIKVLRVPPATGAIIWALELYKGIYPSLEERENIIREVERQLAIIEK